MHILQNNYVIGIDGGDAKTIAALANFEGKILTKAKQRRTVSCHPRDLGLKKAIENLSFVIKKVLKNF